MSKKTNIKYVYTVINTHIFVRIITHIADIHEKSINIHVKVCIQK